MLSNWTIVRHGDEISVVAPLGGPGGTRIKNAGRLEQRLLFALADALIVANTQSPAPGVAAALDLFQRLCADHLYPNLSPLLPLVKASAAAVPERLTITEERAAALASYQAKGLNLPGEWWNQYLAGWLDRSTFNHPPLPAQVQEAEVTYAQFDELWMLFEQYSAEFDNAGKQETLTQKRAEIDAWLINFAAAPHPSPAPKIASTSDAIAKDLPPL